MLSKIDPASPENYHIQAVSRATLSQEGRPDEIGTAVFEQLIFGRYLPMDMHSNTDVVR